MLVLASASPRRRELLAQAGFAFDVHPAHIPEEPYPGEEPVAYVIRLAREKAEAVYKELWVQQISLQMSGKARISEEHFSPAADGFRRGHNRHP